MTQGNDTIYLELVEWISNANVFILATDAEMTE